MGTEEDLKSFILPDNDIILLHIDKKLSNVEDIYLSAKDIMPA